MLERVRRGLFAQLVVLPLFSEHRILTQVAGHDSNVIKILPPLVLSETDIDDFVDALDATVDRAQKLPRAMVRFALKTAQANRPGRRRLAWRLPARAR
jgi:hypothetical protein